MKAFLLATLFQTLSFITFFPGFSQDSLMLRQALKQIEELRGNKPDSLIVITEQALPIARQLGDAESEARLLHTRGGAQYFKGDFELALRDQLAAAKIYGQIGLVNGHAAVLNDIGTLFKKQNNLKSARSYFEEALQIATAGADSSQIANSTNNLGLVYVLEKNYDQAITNYKKSVAIKAALNDRWGLSFDYNNLAEAYSYQGKFEEAIRYMEEAMLLKQEENDHMGTAIAINNMGEIFTQMGDYRQALAYYKQALDSVQVHPYPDFESHVLHMLSQTSERLGNVNQAFSFYKKHIELKDSLFNVRKSEQLLTLQTQYETEKKEEQLKTLRAETALQALEIRQNRELTIGIVILAALLIAAVILVNSQRRYRLKAELAQEKEQLQRTRFKAVIDAEESERKRIARELHDGLGQLLSTARITLSVMDEDGNLPKVQNSMKLIDMAVSEVRSISHNMMPQALISMGLDAALEDMVRKINLAGKVTVHFDQQTTLHLDESEAVAVYRAVQESINNALKYAEATTIELKLTETDYGPQLIIHDNGKGFDTTEITRSTGIGWSNIHSRMELIGGDFNIFSKFGEGTTIKLTLPNHDRANQSIAS